jgi:hypothetical protein
VRQHGVHFPTVNRVFLDPQRIEREDTRASYREMRLEVIEDGRRAGVRGDLDPAQIPWLIEYRHIPEFACVAGEAFNMMIGSISPTKSSKANGQRDLNRGRPKNLKMRM